LSDEEEIRNQDGMHNILNQTDIFDPEITLLMDKK
jgi:hypothetical protein